MLKKNIELLKRLRTRFLRMRHPKHFNMWHVIQKTDCGAAMCIAGHALELAGYTRKYNRVDEVFEWFEPNGKRVNPLVAAERELGLPGANRCYDDGESLDTRNGLFFKMYLRTPKQAAQEIEALIKDSVPAR